MFFECGTSVLSTAEEKEEKGRKVIKIRTTTTEDMRHLRCGQEERCSNYCFKVLFCGHVRVNQKYKFEEGCQAGDHPLRVISEGKSFQELGNMKSK